MKTTVHATALFDEARVLHDLSHYLPAQAPLKDFVHHNTLHAFQDRSFFEALRESSEIFGYKSSLTIEEFRELYRRGLIQERILQQQLKDAYGEQHLKMWLQRMFQQPYDDPGQPRIGALRDQWKQCHHIDLDNLVHPTLFRLLCNYLDQGISIWPFPLANLSLLEALRHLERDSWVSLFQSKRAKALLLDEQIGLRDLLALVVGKEEWFDQYLFDQQFRHQGWSGMVAAVENQPMGLLDSRAASLRDLIHVELLLEIDALDRVLGPGWQPLAADTGEAPEALLAPVLPTERDEVIRRWQEALEWSFFDQILAGIQQNRLVMPAVREKSFQALFCIDDREGSFRRYLESYDPNCETFGTPGFFGVDTYFQPQDGQFYTKVCPNPVRPKHLIKEYQSAKKRQRDAHFSKHAHSFHSGWLITQTLGFWSALRLFINLFRPSMSPATSSSFQHMDPFARLTIENRDPADVENELQIGYTVDEMAERVYRVLGSIGLVKEFAPLVYVVGHGASSVNNPHYAAYDCGACSGRAGSVNARAFAYMANHLSVRELLRKRGIDIPASTHFLGALRDTTRDDITFFDIDSLSLANQQRHAVNEAVYTRASQCNAKERSRRFDSIESHLAPEVIHKLVQRRSVSLFEPRPELNHATNALCIVGQRSLSRGMFMDRRAFLNSYDWRLDADGAHLLNILNAAVPVCGGINLEYYFSRVDNQKLGAGSKLPHNVMGLVGVANGMDGDLRPGLPKQMIEVHDPLRLLLIVEQRPDLVMDVIRRNEATYGWIRGGWVLLVAVEPETRAMYRFEEGKWLPYEPLTGPLEQVNNLETLIESHQDNFPVYLINQPN